MIPLAEYERRRRDLERKEQALAQQEDELSGEAEQRVGRAGLAESVTAFCQRVQQGLAQASFEQKRQLVMLLIDQVIVADGRVEIRYVFPTSLASEQTRFCPNRSHTR